MSGLPLPRRGLRLQEERTNRAAELIVDSGYPPARGPFNTRVRATRLRRGSARRVISTVVCSWEGRRSVFAGGGMNLLHCARCRGWLNAGRYEVCRLPGCYYSKEVFCNELCEHPQCAGQGSPCIDLHQWNEHPVKY
jgi:hypothetical protein